MDYQGIAWFNEVVRAGSFSGAATKLSVGKSTLSERVTALERELGADLLIRTTRKLSLTEAGARLFESSSRSLAELDAAHDEVVARQSVPKGTLRVSAPLDLAGSVLAQALARAVEPWPELKLELDFSDRFVDLVAERFDLAIRAGALDDSTLIARRIGTSVFVVVASPAYLKAHGTPRHPDDLSSHRCLSFTALEKEWELISERARRRLLIEPHVTTSSFVSIRGLALDGVGVGLLPAHLCRQALREGSLTRVLPDWTTRRSPVHLVYPRQGFLQPKVKVVLPRLEKEIRALFLPS